MSDSFLVICSCDRKPIDFFFFFYINVTELMVSLLFPPDLGCCSHDDHTSQQPSGGAEEVSGLGQELSLDPGGVLETRRCTGSCWTAKATLAAQEAFRSVTADVSA